MTAPIRTHEDPVLFREAVNFTAAQTRFLPRLIEKDYFCTVLLNYLAAADDTLIFKGGTCLAKVHAEFYRLSEDLDFVIPDARRRPPVPTAHLGDPPERGGRQDRSGPEALPDRRAADEVRTTRPNTSPASVIHHCSAGRRRPSRSRWGFASRC